VRADLDTLVIALYCASCALFPSERTPRRGRPELITDNELLALMVAQMLLQCPSDRLFLRRARLRRPARASLTARRGAYFSRRLSRRPRPCGEDTNGTTSRMSA
jgi:hypothetical protein